MSLNKQTVPFKRLSVLRLLPYAVDLYVDIRVLRYSPKSCPQSRGITVNSVPYTAGLPRLPRYSHRTVSFSTAQEYWYIFNNKINQYVSVA